MDVANGMEVAKGMADMLGVQAAPRLRQRAVVHRAQTTCNEVKAESESAHGISGRPTSSAAI